MRDRCNLGALYDCLNSHPAARVQVPDAVGSSTRIEDSMLSAHPATELE